VRKIWPLGWLDRPALLHEFTEGSRPLRVDGRPVAFLDDKFVEHFNGIGEERRLIRKDVPEEHTIGVNIRGEVVRLRLGYLWRHVADGPGETGEVVGSVLVLILFLQFLGKTHVEDLDLPANVKADVVGLDISVDDAVAFGRQR